MCGQLQPLHLAFALCSCTKNELKTLFTSLPCLLGTYAHNLGVISENRSTVIHTVSRCRMCNGQHTHYHHNFNNYFNIDLPSGSLKFISNARRKPGDPRRGGLISKARSGNATYSRKRRSFLLAQKAKFCPHCDM
jgi:hypothetical protein